MQVKGFTLIEISIVLVIIGILTAGIIAVKSLISTAEIQKLARDLGQYEIAIKNFRMNFKYYPGDSPYFSYKGNGNHHLLDAGGCLGDYRNIEQFQAWGQLSESKHISKEFDYYHNNCNGITDTSNYTPNIKNSKNWYEVDTYKFDIKTEFHLNFYLDPIDILALESKLGTGQAYQQYYDSGGGNLVLNPANIGLNNYNGVNNCLDISDAVVSCSSSTAVIGRLKYSIPMSFEN